MGRGAKSALWDGKGWSLGRLAWAAAASLRVVAELARARNFLRHLSPRDIERRNRALADCRGENPDLAVRIGWLVPRVAKRVPWRADCLVQALAAQNWLASQDIGTSIVIGVDRPLEGDFGAHAWLKRGDDIVLGGEINRYAILFDSAPQQE
jgi:hypothetical protein